MDSPATVDFGQPIPLFPLNQCVLLPHTTAPLHIFEPRYRAMVHDALEADGLIATATFASDEWKHNYGGNPAIRDRVCVGHIRQHDRLHDGRYNILLQGLCRARVSEELPPDLDGYRLAMLEPIEPSAAMEIDLDSARKRLDLLLRDQTLQRLATVSRLQKLLHGDVSTDCLIDVTVHIMCRNVEHRYHILAAADPTDRAAWLERLLRRTLDTLETAERMGDGLSDDGYALN